MSLNNQNNLKLIHLSLLLCIITLISCSKDSGCESDNIARDWRITEEFIIDECSSDFNVTYSIYVFDDNIFVAYYDKNHQLSLAKRERNGEWDYEKIPEVVDWDNHKSIGIILDKNGFIHLCANMHASPLVYYRSLKAKDIHSLEKFSMVGRDETACTYPIFSSEDNRLLFHYRSGASGNGVEIFNIFDYASNSWERLLDKPLFDGEGKCNAYMVGPKMSKDGTYHVIWCWRNTSDCSTNHGLYYAYSSDFVKWYALDGFSSNVPITPSRDNYMIDDIPVGGGLINIGFQLGFTSDSAPIVVYHKYDKDDYR